MSWMELSLNTTREAVDWVCTLLSSCHAAENVQIQPYSESEPDWVFTICIYLPYDSRVNAKAERIAELLSPLHRTGLTTELEVVVLEEKPTPSRGVDSPAQRIGDRFVVLAPDAPYHPTEEEVPLRLQPSLSFGSGLHPATRLSLQLLERHLAPTMNVLDLGCGSGILSVAMAKLGATVLALDNDRVAVQSTQDAVDLNGVAQQVTVQAGSLGCGSEMGHWMGGALSDAVPTLTPIAAFDLIMANILSRIHMSLAQDYHRALRQTEAHEGLLITAGFTTDAEADVHAALSEAGFEAVDVERDNEWVAFAHRLKV